MREAGAWRSPAWIRANFSTNVCRSVGSHMGVDHGCLNTIRNTPHVRVALVVNKPSIHARHPSSPEQHAQLHWFRASIGHVNPCSSVLGNDNSHRQPGSHPGRMVSVGGVITVFVRWWVADGVGLPGFRGSVLPWVVLWIGFKALPAPCSIGLSHPWRKARIHANTAYSRKPRACCCGFSSGILCARFCTSAPR